MLRTVLIVAAASGLALSAGLVAQPSSGITWSIDSGRSSGDKVQLTLESRSPGNRSSWSNTRSLSELQGLTSQSLLGPSHPVRFTMVGDAGRLDCNGSAGGTYGRGN